ncbi:MAG TPA: transcription termination factor NusA [Actinomycetota bacterium]|nr:transcription termination factor NusA [Actinomycetota bacterium]
MSAELVEALRELEREKGISFETILRGLEEALASAYKSWVRGHVAEEEEDQTEDFRVTLDPESGDMRVFHQQLDEDGTVTSEEEVPAPEDFKGRIAAQTAKQVILQKLRDAEREITYEEFAGREGDVVTGIVQQDSHRYTLLDLGKVEALLPVQEQVPAESYRHGERLKAYIVEVRRTSKGPQIIVSRTHPELLKKLFELEVPEVAEGIVELKAVAREPGHRSKVAVVSHEPGVDAVGACVGAKGSRVRMVVNELKGEKIDVVEWSDDPSRFVAKALAPASVKEVRILEDKQTAEVIVPDYQLSLAIGKEGQNARLAARLTGWRIDIKSESQVAEEEAARRARPVEQPPAAEPSSEERPTEEPSAERPAEEPSPEEHPAEEPSGGETAAGPDEPAAPNVPPVPEAGPEPESPEPSEAQPRAAAGGAAAGDGEPSEAPADESAPGEPEADPQQVAPGEPSPETLEAAPQGGEEAERA